jgi:hypothetical protein
MLKIFCHRSQIAHGLGMAWYFQSVLMNESRFGNEKNLSKSARQEQ